MIRMGIKALQNLRSICSRLLVFKFQYSSENLKLQVSKVKSSRMGKLLVILACVLVAVSAGRIPLSNDRISWQRDLQRQNVRPTLMDLARLRWQVSPWIGLQWENRGVRPVQVLRQDAMDVNRQQNRINSIWGNRDSQLEDRNEQIETEMEERYNRVPINRDVLEGTEVNLPTSDVNSTFACYYSTMGV